MWTDGNWPDQEMRDAVAAVKPEALILTL